MGIPFQPIKTQRIVSGKQQTDQFRKFVPMIRRESLSLSFGTRAPIEEKSEPGKRRTDNYGNKVWDGGTVDFCSEKQRSPDEIKEGFFSFC